MRYTVRMYPSHRAVLCLLFIAVASSWGSPEKTKAAGSFGSVVIVNPASLFGGAVAAVSYDGIDKKYTTGDVSFAAEVKEGEYDVYAMNASKPGATISVKDGKELYIARTNDQAARLLLEAMRGHAASRGELKKILRDHPSTYAVSDSAEWAEVMIVCPASAFGDRAALLVGDKRRNEAVARRTLSAHMLPGAYAVYDSASAKPMATLTVASGELLYAVSRADASSQRQLGDIFYDNGNRAGALVLYRGALAVDSTTSEIYKRYADLALALAGGSEAITALLRLDRAGMADGRDYQALGGLLAAANRNAEAQAMYDKALKMANSSPSVFAGLGAAKSKTGDLAGAAAAYENAIKLVPDSSKLYQLAGDVYLRQKDTARAIAAYNLFFQKGGRNSATAMAAGRCEFAQGNFKEARRFLLMVTGQARQKPDYVQLLGESYYQLKDYAKAQVLLFQTVKNYPHAARWQATAEMLLYSLVKTKDYTKAGFLLEKYAKSSKAQPATVGYFRAELKERSSAKAATTLYEQNIKKYPGDYRSYLGLGTMLSADPKSLGRALELLKKSTSLADTVAEGFWELASVYRKLNRPDDELSALKVYNAADPQNAEANARIGELMLRKGNAGEAVEKLEAATAATPDDPAVLKALAQGYAATGKYDTAIAVLQRAKASAPKDLAVRERLIDLLGKQGPPEKLLDEYKLMLDLRRDTVTLFTYARLLYENGKFADAENTLEDLRAVRPDYVKGLMLLARVLRAQQKYSPAVDVYKEVASIDPGSVEALFERAQTHLENGQPYWAELFYQRTLKQNPRYARAELGLARVAKLRRNYTAYKIHVNKAHALAPDDPAIEQELAAAGKGAW